MAVTTWTRVPTAHPGGAAGSWRAAGAGRRLAVLLGMLVLLGGFVGMHQMSGSPLAHGPSHPVTAEAAPHAAGDLGAQEGAPSGPGHGEVQAMCLLVLVVMVSLGGPALWRRLPDAGTHRPRVVAPWWRLGSALRPPSLVALGISRR